MAAIFDIHGYNVSPITAATINSNKYKISSPIASIIDLYNGYINPRRYADELPEDLWIQIFVRLSVKPLLRVICVCKHWYVLIKDPRFTRKHLQFQKTISKNMGHFLFHHEDHRDCVFNYFAFDGESVTNALKSLLSLPSYRSLFHFYQEEMCYPFYIDGPINGLYCLYNGEGRIVIWNPATKEVGFLPLPNPYLPGGKRYLYGSTIGFGTDPLDEEHYKVILHSRSLFTRFHEDASYVMLYTTKTNIWRPLKVVDRPIESLNNTYLNGSYYWMSGRVVLEFDMSKETFRYISAPEFDMSKETFRYIAAPCKGKLALHNDRITLFDTNPNLNEIDIWVMLEESNWLKLKKICLKGFQGRVMDTLGFWKTENNLLIVIDDSNSSLHTQTVVYNTTTQGIMNIGPRGHSGSFKACVYYESLVSLGGEIIKYKGDDNASFFDTVCDFLLEDLSDDDEDDIQ